MEKGGEAGLIQSDKTTVMLEPDKNISGGLLLPGKDRVVFRPPERKSLLGLDVLASAKRGIPKVDSGFKVPREKGASVVSSMDEEESSELSAVDEVGSDAINRPRSQAVNRRYRETAASETSRAESTVIRESQVGGSFGTRHSSEHIGSDNQIPRIQQN